MMHHLRILHLSDLHECAEFADISDERRDLVRSQAGSRNRVLGISFLEILRTINSKGKIDLICFTGDVADWGLNEEYRQATTLFNNILKTTGVSKERIFVVPGNHDINRKTSEEAWNKMRLWGKRNPDRLSEWMMASSKKCPEGAILTWREEIQKRSANFWSWVSNDLQREKLVPRKNPHSRLGYQVKINDLGFPFDIHVIGIDSAWLAGDDDDTSYLQITENQVDMLTRDNGILLPGLKLVLVHHPLKNLLDGDRSFRLLADSVNLLLHGHQHDEIIETQINPDRKLYCFAAGCIYESEKYINSFHVLDILLNDNGEPLKYDIDFWGWSAKGYWCLTGMFFKAAPNGHYSTKTELGEKTLPPDKIEIKVIGKKRRNEDDFFDERFQDRIEQRAKTNTLLTIDEKILICIYGYPGMGKTTLVEKVLWEIEKGKYPDNVLQNKWDGILYLQKEELKFDILFDRIKSLSPYEMQQELELIKRACQELDKKIIILLEVLKKERIIILLDGADDLFDENGKFKKECEDFKLFCKLALKNNIASKILITSNKPLEFYDEFSEEFDENFINEHTHTEELNEGLPKEFALSYLRALDESGRSGLKNATDDQLSRIAKITYGIPRALQLVHHLLSNKNNTDLNLDNIIDQFYDIEKVVKSFVEISNKKLDAVSKQIVEVLSIFNRPVPKEAIIFVLQNLLDKNLIITSIKNLAVTHLINWHRNEKFESVYSLPPIDQEYSYLHIPITGESYNCKELHSHAANYYELLGKEEDWKEIKTIEHPKIYEYEQLVKAKDFDKAASVIDSIDYSWTNHHKYLAHLMALGYGNYLIKHREKLEDKLSNKSLEACNLTSLGWLCRRMGRKKEAEKHLSDAVELARESASDLPQIYALSELGYFYTDNAGKHDEAENHLKEALKIAIKSRDIYSQANIYLGLAFVCFQRPGENDASLANAKRSLDLFSKLTTPLAYFRQIDCWDRLGMIYRKMGLFSDAMRTAEEGLKIAENHGFIDWKAELYSSKGFHLRAQGLFTEAIESHEVALNLFEKKCGMKREEAVQYGYLANLYAELGLLDKAFAAYEKAYIIVNEVGLRRELSWILSNKGALLCKLGNYEEALRLQQSALNIVIENDHFDSQVIRYTDLAVTQFLMQQYTESESSLHQALRCASINEKKELPTDFPEEFLRASVQEDNLPHEMQSPDDHTRRGVILARIYLHKGKVKEALKIIQHVNKFQNKLSPNKHITMAVYAITLHNEGKNIQKAIDAYKKTIEISDKLLVSEPDYYPAINSKGLAFIGLSLLMQGRIVEKYKNESKKTLTYGQKICNAKGVQKDIILLLKNLPVNQKFIKSIFPT